MKQQSSWTRTCLYGVALFVLLLLSFSAVRSEKPLSALSPTDCFPTPQPGGTIPPLHLSKTVNRSYVSASSPVTFEIRINNPCAGFVYQEMGITDTLPSGLFLAGIPQSTSSEQPVVRNNTILWSGRVSDTQIVVTYPVTGNAVLNEVPVTNTVVFYEIRNPITATTSLTLSASASVLIKNRWDLHLPIVSRFTRLPLPAFNGNLDDVPTGTGWTQYSARGYPLVVKAADVVSGPDAESSPNIAWLGGAFNETAALSQAVAVPPRYDGLQLLFYYQVISGDACGKDLAWVQLTDADNPTTTFRAWTKDLCRSTQTSDWVRVGIEVPIAYQNRRVNISFHGTFDGNGNSNVFFDTISFCSAEPDTLCASSTLTNKEVPSQESAGNVSR